MKLRDTKLGQWLKNNAPKVLDVVGDLLPDKGVLGIVKNIIDMDENIPQEQKLEFERNRQLFELEIEKLDAGDRISARTRETDFVKAAGHIDWMQTIVGCLVMITFLGVLVLVGFKELPKGSEHLMINAIGIMEGLVLSVVGYYFGSSAGSRIKDMKGK